MPEPALGRPRSERARRAILESVDDLLVEQGYAAITMKAIAERAGVGRQTVYRWWGSKAEILLEATIADAAHALEAAPAVSSRGEVVAYQSRLLAFLTESDAGHAYRALIGEAQHDPQVAAMMAAADVLAPSAQVAIDRIAQRGDARAELGDEAVAMLVGPVLYAVFADATLVDASTIESLAARFCVAYGLGA